MKHAIAIAKAKVKKQIKGVSNRPEQSSDIDQEVSKAGLGVLFVAGALIGIGGFISLMGGLIHSGGLGDLVVGWLSAMSGM